jgi:hypothetical protein
MHYTGGSGNLAPPASPRRASFKPSPLYLIVFQMETIHKMEFIFSTRPHLMFMEK